MTAMPPITSFAEKRRILQLETLHDLALALHAERTEEDLVEELLQRVCAVLDPAAAVAVTRGAGGDAAAVAVAGWRGKPPSGEALLAEPLWQELLAAGEALAGGPGVLAGRRYEALLAAPLVWRGSHLGYLALLDKEARGAASAAFPLEDRRFLESVTALAAVALDGARRLTALAGERERLAEENKALRGRLLDEVRGQRIVAHALPMRRVLDLVERVAPRGVNVLVRGESGSGKELVAKLLHVGSGRPGSLVALNCGALPESLLESELFGIEGGVATGVQARRGKLELAHGGTLFLDEIGDMGPALQVKLLRALQEREVQRVGGERPLPVDARVIAATHRDLDAMIAAGTFREDLYYRLKGVEIVLPPLRERREDIPYLVRQFTTAFCAREGIPAPAWRRDALALLLAHDFPGNVRELQNLVEGAITLAEREIDGELVRSLLGAGAATASEALDLDGVARRHIARVLRLTGGNRSEAARLLGLSRRTLLRKGF
ncbi:MAG: Transcriptional regulatory protein ZraR [Acidobacteria bacterium ADurb.Bin051]|jgi:transcriptional regulator with GAF, ATPase, and Fis domain|nr:MAG: Transcriptional regulatory protein ZraR [Acidobacteria bacterium ADurb.Bin051]